MRILAIVQYDGTNYSGWQVQPSSASIQSTIEDAFKKILSREIKIYGSGRTDTGVHAQGQTFHFDLDENLDLEKLRYSLNSVLPSDIRLLSFKEVSEDFHARHSAKSKTYQYILNLGEKNVFTNKYEEQFNKPLNIDEIRKAAQVFEGKHCFQNFTTKEEDQDNFIRTINCINVEFTSEKRLIIRFNGDGFMRYMIRFLVGTLIQVGIGKLSVSDIEYLLTKKERLPVSYKASAKGLSLEEVIY